MMYKNIYNFLIILFILAGSVLLAQETITKSVPLAPDPNFKPETIIPSYTEGNVKWEETFDTVTQPSDWLVIDNDGSGSAYSFEQLIAFTSGDTVRPQAGQSFWFSNFTNANASGLIDEWLISPQVPMIESGDSLVFYAGAIGGSYPDSLKVLISTTDQNPGSFTEIAYFQVEGPTGSWHRYAFDLSAFAGSQIYVAVNYYIVDGGPSGNNSDNVWVDHFIVTTEGGSGGTVLFEDNFDSYTAGLLVACQNPVDWTTWSNAPCGAEDAEVSNAHAFSGANSAKIITNDDLVKALPTILPAGKYQIDLMVYIPAGKAGYFNTLATFAGSNSDWGMEVYFDVGGGGRVNGGSATAVNFSWTPDTWHSISHVVDLDNDFSEFYFDGVLVHSWQWTLGANGAGGPNTLHANDFFGATANDEMYFDDYKVIELVPVPVELSAFAANVNATGDVVLNWTTETEVNNQGFEIQRRSENNQYLTIGHVNGFGTTTERKQYSYTDVTVEPGVTYYRLKQIDFNGNYEYSNEIMVDVHPPLAFGLDQNYPNPFNPSTNIKFSIAEPTFVKLAVYNLLGEEVGVLKNEFMQAGFYQVSFDALSLPSGMYIYKLETAQYSSVKKMMLMK